MLSWKSVIRIGQSIHSFLRNKERVGKAGNRSELTCQTYTMHSASKTFVIRLRPQEDLRMSLLKLTNERPIKATSTQRSGTKKNRSFEIFSCTSTLSKSCCHLHHCAPDINGTLGGHLPDNTLVYTTALIAITEFPDLKFKRQPDPLYRYFELAVQEKKASL